MNLVTKTLAVSTLLFSGAATLQAQSLTFNLTGTILPGACRLSAADVDLGTYNTTDFTGVGTTQAFVDVPISSSGCDPLITTLHMQVSGTADAANNAYFKGVSGIGIELQQKSPVTAIAPAGTTVNFTASTAATTYYLQARFRQTVATVAAGTVSSAVTILATYN